MSGQLIISSTSHLLWRRENENSKNLSKGEGVDLAIIVTDNAFLV